MGDGMKIMSSGRKWVTHASNKNEECASRISLRKKADPGRRGMKRWAMYGLARKYSLDRK